MELPNKSVFLLQDKPVFSVKMQLQRFENNMINVLGNK